MRYQAIVTHNHGDTALWRYHPGDPLAEAARLVVEADTPAAACEHAWVVCNVDTAAMLPATLAHHDGDTTRYRARRNRSLSTGDVIILTELPDHADEPDAITGEMTAWTPVTVGFTRLDTVPDYRADDPNARVSEAFHAMSEWAERD